MNYFAHAVRFLDRPHFLAGLAVPDWLSVADRKVRVRRRGIEREFASLAGEDREIAAGILQHLEDDQWFHASPGFFAVTGALSRQFRETLGNSESWQCGFLGHLLTELLLDAVLIERTPQRLTEYYAVLEQVDPGRVEQLVGKLANRETARLGVFIELFKQERFLEDYQEDSRLLRRINQVMLRVGLPSLPDAAGKVLESGRETVRHRAADLLPEQEFWNFPPSGATG